MTTGKVIISYVESYLLLIFCLYKGENNDPDAPHTSGNNDDIMPYYNQFSIDEKDDSDDSDNGEFITIKVTNEDGQLEEKNVEHKIR